MNEIIEISKGLLTPLIAIVMVYIAIQQFKLAKSNAKIQRYDKSLSVYKAIVDFLGIVIVNGAIQQKDISKLLVDTSESKFLFGKEITEYIDLLYKNGVKIMTTNKMYDMHVEREEKLSKEKVQKLAVEQEELFNWFAEQFDKSAKLFMKYLKIKI